MVISKLGRDIRIFKYQEHGREYPLIIANGCPVDFRVFNLVVAYFAAGGVGNVTEECENGIRALWERVGYKLVPKAGSTWVGGYPIRKADSSPYFHTQECVFEALGVDPANLWDNGVDILPKLQEISEQLRSE